ncbi:hypothetical protein [Nocardioides sp.]|uniref:hypothetical protein n=1 Tax=Nocardioides sp. TaxID=35761 RepID=UPI002B270C58|nr:hypothetical protein [Nocardioides sp.]
MGRDRNRVPTSGRTISVDRAQFYSGTRLALLHQLARPGLSPDDVDVTDLLDSLGIPVGITFDVIRPADLVALTVVATECDLVGGDGTAVLRPREGATALLVVTYPFQHLLEEARFEQQAPRAGPDGEVHPDPDPSVLDPDPVFPRVQFLPARSSRVVFVMDGDIEFSRAGVLAAMGRLELAVHAHATPGVPLRPGLSQPKWGTDLVGPVHHLGSGLVLQQTPTGPMIGKATRDLLRQAPAPDPATTAGRAQLRDSIARAQAILSRQTPTVVPGTKIPEDSIFRPGGALVPDVLVPPGFSRRKLSKPATGKETAIEAPFRLQMSPSVVSGWAHAVDPVAASDTEHHVELWHSRLALRTSDGSVDERSGSGRTVRAVWARDRDGVTGWEEPDLPPALEHGNIPFIASLDRADRHMIVRQTAETWTRGGPGNPAITPAPVEAEQLWLSSLGAWLDLHGAWDAEHYSKQEMEAILNWDHIAPMGRDQFVRVTYPGYLFPLGHNATLVKVTERKMKTVAPSVAALYQRMFIVVNERFRVYPESQANWPFGRVDVLPLVTPAIDQPEPPSAQSSYFWPTIGKVDLPWRLDAQDREGRPVRLNTPLMWVASSFRGDGDRPKVEAAYAGSVHRHLDAAGQKVSFVPRGPGNPDVDQVTETIHLHGTALEDGGSTPRMTGARVRIDAVEQLSPVGGVDIAYDPTYVDQGAGTGPGQVWALTVGDAADLNPTPSAPTKVEFGGAGAGSDQAGGFLTPSLPVRGLSRDGGPIGDPAGVAAGVFKPAAFLAGVLPKLFGLIPLDELIAGAAEAVGLDQAPKMVSETLGRIARLHADVQQAIDAASDAIARAQTQGAAIVAKAEAVKASAEAVRDQVDDLLDDPSVAAAHDLAAALTQLATDLRELAGDLPNPQVTQQLTALADLLAQSATMIEEVADDLDLIVGLLQDPSKLEGTFRYEWRPAIRDDVMDVFPFLEITGDHDDVLSLCVEGRAGVSGAPAVTVTAEIRNIALLLFAEAPLMRLELDHLYFRSGSAGKTEIDARLKPVEFLGVLGFVQTIQELIPLDGFSDPPFVEVDASGARAGFTLAIPSVAVGVFNLANVSLGADVDVPFLGGELTAGFNFCSREKPFTLTVMCLGGGGWLALRVAPDGLEVLELGLEATACLAVDLGVASGSISCSVGVYLRLEGEDGSLTGYFRLRGEVDVLGLISASIELYMELVYNMSTGKLIGSATITVTVDVLVFSGTVSIHAERQLAGGNGDPSFRDVLGAADGTSQYWTDYCDAFA